MNHNRRDFLRDASRVVVGSTVAALGKDSAAKDPRFSRDDTGETHLEWNTLLEVSHQVRSGEISSTELTELTLNRIEDVDGTLRSFTTVMKQSDLKAAQQADREIRKKHYRGRLHGIPVAVKDLIYTKGVRTTAAIAHLFDFVPEYNATVVNKLQEAGAVIVGKLSLTGGAMVGYHHKFKIPKNPWNENVWPGDSSSGSGVATAAGLAYATLGTDTGGSIRFPSAACGVVGLKPTYGLVSRYGVFPLAESMDHVGPMARSTADCAAVLEAIAGADVKDPTTLSHGPLQILKTIDKGIKGIRLGWDEQYATDGVDRDVVTAVRGALDMLEKLGARIVKVSLPNLRPAGSIWTTLCSAEAVVAHRRRMSNAGCHRRPAVTIG